MFTKHYDSYQKNILMCSHKYLTIKPVYTTLCLYTKKYQSSHPNVFTKHYDKTISKKKDPNVFTKHYDPFQKTKFHINQLYVIKHLNPIKPYNFVSLHKKITKHYDSYKSDLTIKPVYTTLCLYTKKYQRSQCVTKHKTLCDS